MLPKTHIFLGAVFSFLLVVLFEVPVYAGVIVFFSSFFIDVDHYFYGVYKKKTFSWAKIYSFFVEEREMWRKLSYVGKKKTKFPILLFHGGEFLIILFLLSFLSDFLLFVLLGCGFHLVLDYVDIFVNKDPLFVKASVLYVLLTNHGKKEL